MLRLETKEGGINPGEAVHSIENPLSFIKVDPLGLKQ